MFILSQIGTALGYFASSIRDATDELIKGNVLIRSAKLKEVDSSDQLAYG